MATTPVIKIKDETKQILDEIKIHPRETYDDVIKRLINKEYENDNQI